MSRGVTMVHPATTTTITTTTATTLLIIKMTMTDMKR